MATHITQIGKQKFICGLFWQSLSRPRDLWKEAVQLARKIDADLVVLRKDHAVAQAGYAHTREGARRGMYSLAAAISKTVAIEGAFYDGQVQPVHNWLAAIKLPDGAWCYCAVRDANFLPNGDFAGTKDEVVERLLGDYGLGGWNVVLGDPELEEYGLHNFNPKVVHQLLPKGRAGNAKVHHWWGLRPVETRVAWTPFIVAGLVLTAACMGGYYYWKAYQKRMEEERRQVAIAAVREQLSAVPPEPVPWSARPLARAMLETCLAKLRWLAPGGWQLQNYKCTENGVNYRWTRNGSTAGFLLEHLPDAVIETGGEQASRHEILSPAPGGDEGLLEASKGVTALMSDLQLAGLASSIAPKPDPGPSGIPNLLEGAPVKPKWKTYEWSIRLEGMPLARAVSVLDRQGIRVSQVTYQAGGWTVEGVFYVR